MTPPERPDLAEVQSHLKWLVAVIAVVLLALLGLTLYLYQRFTAGVTVTP